MIKIITLSSFKSSANFQKRDQDIIAVYQIVDKTVELIKVVRDGNNMVFFN